MVFGEDFDLEKYDGSPHQRGATVGQVEGKGQVREKVR